MKNLVSGRKSKDIVSQITLVYWKAGMRQFQFYVTPFYNSKGPQIDVGPFSKQLATATADRSWMSPQR